MAHLHLTQIKITLWNKFENRTPSTTRVLTRSFYGGFLLFPISSFYCIIPCEQRVIVMAFKPSPKKNSKIIQKYINEYAGKKHYDYETKYKLTPEEVLELCDFADKNNSQISLYFYNFSIDDYDKKTILELCTFASGTTEFPNNRYEVNDDGIVFNIDVCVPSRAGVIDKALINEILSHELTHVYRAYREYQEGHILAADVSERKKLEAEQVKQNPKIKFTFSQKNDRYRNILFGIKNDFSIQDDFKIIAYTLCLDEINATLAGIDAFLYENNGDNTKLPICRSVIEMYAIRMKLDNLIANATDKDWEYCRKNALYIHERKDESITRFKKRYAIYYTKQINYFYEKLQKLVKKHKLQKAQENLSNKRSTTQNTSTHFEKNSYEI